MDWSTPGFPVLHYPLEFAQTHVHWVGDIIQLLSPPSPTALYLSGYQTLIRYMACKCFSHFVVALPFLFKHIFIWLCWVLVAARGSLIFIAMWGIFSCSRWDLLPWLGIEPGPPALGAWSFSHWTTRELLIFPFFIVYFEVQIIYLFIYLFIWLLVLASLSLQPPPELCNQQRNSRKQADSFPTVCSRYCISLTNGDKSYPY